MVVRLSYAVHQVLAHGYKDIYTTPDYSRVLFNHHASVFIPVAILRYHNVKCVVPKLIYQRLYLVLAQNYAT
jgi:hypothetical protein